MSNAVTVITPAHRAAALIRKGQRAWKAIKGTAEEQRFWWFDVGTALAEGKAMSKDERGGLKFSAWVAEAFPGLDDPHDIADAIWFAANSVTVTESPAGLSHPSRIRRWFNERAAAAPWDFHEPAPEIVKVPETKKFKTQRDAEKFIKVDQRAETRGEGSDTADRMRKAVAKAHGTTVEALRKEAAQAAPDTAYRFNPRTQAAIDGMRSTLRASAAAMQQDGLSLEAIREIFIHFANSL